MGIKAATGIMHTVMEQEIRNINETYEELDLESMQTAVNTICKARNIYIIGIRGCAPLADLLAFNLKVALDHVIRIDTNNVSEIFEQMLDLNEKDVVIGISFPRYSKRTLRAMEYASNHSAKVIALTDSVHSPMCMYSSCNLTAKSSLNDAVNSLTAPVSLINVLVALICKKREKQVAEHLEKLENVWRDYQVYSIDELEYARI